MPSQEENWVDAVEPEVRQPDAARLQGSEPSEPPMRRTAEAEAAAEAPPAMPCQQPPEAPAGADAAVTAAAVAARLAAMLACEGGGPRASGHGPVAFDATLGVVKSVVEGTEATLSAHGEKALRANCGGVLAKDEMYGFALVDLLHGKLCPRGNGEGCAIPLGEKLRKLNKKRQDEYTSKRRAAGKQPAQKREASLAGVEQWHQLKLDEECTAELSPFIPAVGRCAAVQREEARRECAPPKREPTPQREADSPLSGPRARLSEARAQHEKLSERAAQAHENYDALVAQIAADNESIVRFKQQLDRRPSPKPPPSRRMSMGLERDEAEVLKHLEAREAARAAYDAACIAVRDDRQQLMRMMEAHMLLYDQAEVARADADEAEAMCTMFARAQLEKCELEEQLIESELRVLDLHERERNAPKRAALLAAAVEAWGPDHASRSPTAVYDLRGPMPPSPPPCEEHPREEHLAREEHPSPVPWA